jgi:hypothetical protein
MSIALVAPAVLSGLLAVVTPALGQGPPAPPGERPAPQTEPNAKGAVKPGEPDGPVLVLRTFATPLEETVKPLFRLSLREMWQKGERIYGIALVQSRRFHETGQPMVIEQDGVYYQRDLYFHTKGVILGSFFHGALDVGLYNRRYDQVSTIVTGKPLTDFGAYRQGESYVFSGGRQFFVGLRLDVGKLLKRR